MFSPVSGIIHQHSDLNRDVHRINADIFAGLAESPRPIPDISEQTLVQVDRATDSVQSGAPGEIRTPDP